ncbi:hypothetical protein SAMN05660657_05601 [Geodermatophilus amargosae]|uniref:PEP-CTERM protein-sorting domain-containing protein n=1 Tax=Geodermatophilus amargosae TaxID=1296565 RepID=A0A1I7DCA1_9ACTN|nr:DUF6069 family protein [Geodermatophilus amargosae]SFU09214.1 hypothetical protein SAMN05660657_05601 [Geodermatophilus amargosae]
MTSTLTRPSRTVSWKSTAVAAAVGAAGGLVINSVIATLARTLFDIPSEFQQLTLPIYGFLTVVGAIAGAIGWHLVATRSRNAAGVLRVLVPTVLVLSLIPDVLLLVSASQPGTTTAGVVALMLMHVGVAVAAVPAYRTFIPPQS